MPLFLMDCSPKDFQEENGLKERKRPVNANGQFSGTPAWLKTTPAWLKTATLKSPVRGLWS